MKKEFKKLLESDHGALKISEIAVLERTQHDCFGNEILKGSKEHKISFIDQISSQKIAEVVLIDSNFQNNKNNNSNNKDLCQCISCHLF